jgi:uncharacterized protein (DUF2235 family)
MSVPANERRSVPKRLVVCFDGTWNTADNKGNPTNVTRLARAIPPIAADGVAQLVYYDSGVGTGLWDRWIGGMAGAGIGSKIKDAYLFLAQNYNPGDEVYIFGFSRGAFAARSLSGFVGLCGGLLRRDELHQLDSAWRTYELPQAKRNMFKHHELIERSVQKVMIECIGVWDTVGALGIPLGLRNFRSARYRFHNAQLSRQVRRAFQALAIDEKRGPFKPTLWSWPKNGNYPLCAA